MTDRISYPELGDNQKHVLNTLRTRGGVWTPSAGWYYGSIGNTIRILKSLEKHGFVAEAPSTSEYNGKPVPTFVAI